MTLLKFNHPPFLFVIFNYFCFYISTQFSLFFLLYCIFFPFSLLLFFSTCPPFLFLQPIFSLYNIFSTSQICLFSFYSSFTIRFVHSPYCIVNVTFFIAFSAFLHPSSRHIFFFSFMSFPLCFPFRIFLSHSQGSSCLRPYHAETSRTITEVK